jgi:hypothetical protein
MNAQNVNQVCAAIVFAGVGLILLLESVADVRERFEERQQVNSWSAIVHFAGSIASFGLCWWIWHSTFGGFGP